MKSKISLFNVLIGITTLIIACDRPECKNTNQVFDEFAPDSREYKTELIKQLENTDYSKLTYWFKEYVESNGEELLFFNIQGDGLCAVIVLNVEDWKKLEALREAKGVSFSGAEFINLKFDIQQDSANIMFMFRDFRRIAD